MNNEILNLLENRVPRSVTRTLVGKQFFDALVSYNEALDIYSVEVLAVKIRMSKSALKDVFKYSCSDLRLSEKQFVSQYYLQEAIEPQVELATVSLSRRLHDFQYRSYRTVLQKLLNGEK